MGVTRRSNNKRNSKSKKQKTSKHASTSESLADTSTKQLSWPPTDPSAKPLPLDGLLAGLDELLWSAMAHIDPQTSKHQQKKCQVFSREALNLIGMGWVATNTHPYRTALGKGNKYALAMEFFERNKWNPPASLPEIQKVEVVDKELTKSSIFEGSYQHVIQKNIKVMQRELETNGVILIRNAFSNVPENALSMKTNCTPTKIQQTTGNGIAGETKSYYADATSDYWIKVQNHILRGFLCDNDCFEQVKGNKKAIILKYGQGAENHAHQDNNQCDIFPYQATVLFSENFEGGEFYVAFKEESTITRRIVKLENKGDMVIFAASKKSKYFHGMMRVTKGERSAVGLFQPK
ncbi:hypothetical protein CTEN210_12658 [Chaetoceros tenuissimus]|uniref:Fe2OG dioxygenase domain-containing protein n=1 Tax=Chaetoceros tenuissimus TaxID=426638 RepID=A0AAD3D225_9STRA|nr:hypothetical protein CTEN210_12658 [Chaetoceros tenuissimus]